MAFRQESNKNTHTDKGEQSTAPSLSKHELDPRLQTHKSLGSFFSANPALYKKFVFEAECNFGNRTRETTVKIDGEGEMQRRIDILDNRMPNLPLSFRFAFLFFDYWQVNPLNAIEKFKISSQTAQEAINLVVLHHGRYERYTAFTQWIKDVQAKNPEALTNHNYAISEFEYWIAMQVNDRENLAALKTYRQLASEVPEELQKPQQTTNQLARAIRHSVHKLHDLGVVPESIIAARAEERKERIMHQLARHPKSSAGEIAEALGYTLDYVQESMRELHAEGKLSEIRIGRRPGHSPNVLELIASLGPIIQQLGKDHRWDFGEINNRMLAAEATKVLKRHVSVKEVGECVLELGLPSRSNDEVKAAKKAEIKEMIEQGVFDFEEIAERVSYSVPYTIKLMKRIMSEMGLPTPRYFRKSARRSEPK